MRVVCEGGMRGVMMKGGWKGVGVDGKEECPKDDYARVSCA